MIEDYWANCKDEFESRDYIFPILIVDHIKLYKVNLDMEGVEDDG